jgi:Radical SAM N-terminal.
LGRQTNANNLEDSQADMLVYGMGDQPLRDMLKLLKKGVPFESLKTLNQTAVLVDGHDALPKNKNWETVELASHEECLKDKIKYAANFKVVEVESNKLNAKKNYNKK